MQRVFQINSIGGSKKWQNFVVIGMRRIDAALSFTGLSDGSDN